MSDVAIYHPGTGGQASVPEESVWHYRQAGWLLLSEHQENEAAREAAESKPADKKGDR